MEPNLGGPLQHPQIITTQATTYTSAQQIHQASPPTTPLSSRSSLPFGSPSNEHSPSAAARHQLTRGLSPDLPTRDALYLFCNFSSYTRSPQEGSEGIRDNTDFHDTIRLLDFARTLAGNPHAQVHVLHMKYRFQTPDQGLPTTRQEKLSALNYKDDRGRKSTAVPQPFSTLHDSVIKVDYQDNGVFHPLPAQAVFQHISKSCQPPPRIIVVSYVWSKATENHITSLAAWADTSTPPIYVFSPLETRLRERRTLADALYHAIPISMYASPSGVSQLPSPAGISDSQTQPQPHRSKSHDLSSPLATSPHRSRRASTDSRPISTSSSSLGDDHSPRIYPPDPVATLSILPDSYRTHEPITVSAGDRVPLWTLAPGAAILHGSTSASLGVKLSDFSAVNLLKGAEKGDVVQIHQAAHSGSVNITCSDKQQWSGMDGKPPIISLPPLDAHLGRGAALSEPISRTSSAASVRITNGHLPITNGHLNGKKVNDHPSMHLTPPDQDPRHLSPPDLKPPSSLPHSQQSWPKTKSWPTTREKVPGWKRGRREVMEDALEELDKDVDNRREEELAERMSQITVKTLNIGPPRLDDLVLAVLKRSKQA